MASQLHTPPEWIRPALIRHLAAKVKTDEPTLAQRLAPLSDRGIIAALHIDPRRTGAALDKALAVCAPVTVPDHRAITHDGAIWPQPRAKMRDADAIIQRMGDDLRRAAEEAVDQTATRAAMRALGWQNWQLDAYGPEAASGIDAAVKIGRAA